MKTTLAAVVLFLVGIVGSADAVPYQSTTELDRWIWGNGTTEWSMAMPDTFEMPPATVNTALLSIYSNYVNSNNDIVSVLRVLEGDLVTRPITGTDYLTADKNRVSWIWHWTGLNPMEQSVFNVKDNITAPWGKGDPLVISLAFSETWCGDPIFLDRAVLKLDWNDNAASVPEPGTMVLLGFGMLGLVIYGKRRMNNN